MADIKPSACWHRHCEHVAQTNNKYSLTELLRVYLSSLDLVA